MVECFRYIRLYGLKFSKEDHLSLINLILVSMVECFRYIRLYGLKFSKEDHLLLINVMLEVMTIPELDFSLVQKFAQMLTTLLK